MDSSRFIIYLFGLYVLGTSGSMLVLSMFSTIAYHCNFEDGTDLTQVGYFMHILYYRSKLCAGPINWEVFGIQNLTVENTPRIPDELSTVEITYWFSVIHLSMHSVTTLACIVMLVATRLRWTLVNRHLSYWIFFMPVALLLFVTTLLCLTTGALYSQDRLRAYVS